MAKSSRASTNKANNLRLKKNVFGPVEAARAQRLSARLQALAAEPKPVKEVVMEDEPAEEPKEAVEKVDTAMEVDGAKTSKKPKKKVEKRRGKKSSIVFPMRGPKKTKK
ncbi:hypothetical protein BT67DRAFT_437577 [Trichocladium antarcticum]|uniref:DUF2423 domain-containing protein n=1 Tax=Trichocladium antarcticum TaxID=1450529 RepID=A0AAN6US65_9PEZI|nr:hypothetical protein BT67DRAFT_437577 [Trichocladium antarcticum]